nr:YezD family protein [Peribacillus loiseleuriae]
MCLVDQVKANFILSTLKNIEYGSAIITIHDGNITQIDKTEKTRFESKRFTSKNQK